MGGHRNEFYKSNCYLTADVDNESEYYTLNDEPTHYSEQQQYQFANTNRLARQLNYLSNEFNIITMNNQNNSSRQKNQMISNNMLSNHRPQVGVTPETRFRRAPTLDIIRSTKMPVQQTNEHTFNVKQQKFLFNNSTLKKQPKMPIAKF